MIDDVMVSWLSKQLGLQTGGDLPKVLIRKTEDGATQVYTNNAAARLKFSTDNSPASNDGVVLTVNDSQIRHSIGHGEDVLVEVKDDSRILEIRPRSSDSTSDVYAAAKYVGTVVRSAGDLIEKTLPVERPEDKAFLDGYIGSNVDEARSFTERLHEPCFSLVT